MASAPGIRNRKDFGNMATLPTDAVLTLIRQRHAARRAGLHEDTRWGDSTKGLYSFATPKFLPEEIGDKRLMIRQPLHQWSWGDFEGQIPEGEYGAGDVSLIERSPMVLLKNTPDHIVWTRGTSQDSPVYSMRRTKNGNYLCVVRSKDQPTVVKTYKKSHFPMIPIEDVAKLVDQGARVREKIDGASVLAYLGKNGIRAFGTRVGANGMRPEYTNYLGPEIRNAKVPKALQDRLIRGELYGVDAHGKPIHPNELSGLLHSNLVKAIDTKQKKGIRLLIAALAENKNGKDDWYTGADDLVAKLNNPSIHAMPPVTGEAAKRLVAKIVAGKHPLTHEGAVLSFPDGRTYKSKKRDDFDVIVRDIFPAETKDTPRAGGFYYSYPGEDRIAGKVGAGLDYKTLQDMLANPQNYIGREARLASQEQYADTKALRAPSFVAFRAD